MVPWWTSMRTSSVPMWNVSGYISYIVHPHKGTISQLAAEMESFPARNGSKTAQLELVGEPHISVHLSVCGKRMVATWLVPPASSRGNSAAPCQTIGWQKRRSTGWSLAQLTLLLATDNWASNLKAGMPEHPCLVALVPPGSLLCTLPLQSGSDCKVALLSLSRGTPAL